MKQSDEIKQTINEMLQILDRITSGNVAHSTTTLKVMATYILKMFDKPN